jgi:hypothetical protein
VGVPLRDTQRDTLIQLVCGEILGRGVHPADQAITVAAFLVRQGRRMVGIETQRGFEAIAVIGEVMLLLRKVRQKNLKTIGQRGFVVQVFPGHLAGSSDDCGGTLGVAGLGMAQPGHLPMRAHVHRPVFGWQAWREHRLRPPCRACPRG